MAQFDGSDGQCIYTNLFTVTMIIQSCKKNGRYFIRKQFALKVAYIITIYESQGLPLDLIIINLGKYEFAARHMLN